MALAARDHPADRVARVAGHAHQDRRAGDPSGPDRDIDRRKPQVPLGELTWAIRRAARGIGRQVYRTQVPDSLPEHGHPALPADPLGDDRRRHPGMAGEESPNLRLDPVDSRARGRSVVLRWRRRTDRLADGVPRQPEPASDLLDRDPLGQMQASDLGPVFHVEQLLPPRRVQQSQAWARVIESADQAGGVRFRPASGGQYWAVVDTTNNGGSICSSLTITQARRPMRSSVSSSSRIPRMSSQRGQLPPTCSQRRSRRRSTRSPGCCTPPHPFRRHGLPSDQQRRPAHHFPLVQFLVLVAAAASGPWRTTVMRFPWRTCRRKLGVISLAAVAASCNPSQADIISRLPKTIGGEPLVYDRIFGPELLGTEPAHWALDAARAVGADPSRVEYVSGALGNRAYLSEIVHLPGGDEEALLLSVVADLTNGLEVRTVTIGGKGVVQTIRPENPDSADCTPCFYAFDDTVFVLNATADLAAEAFRDLP